MIADVDVDWAPVDVAALDGWTVAEAVAAIQAQDADPVAETAFRLPSTLVDLGPEVDDFARTILAPERPFGQALVALYATIHRDFTYAKGATSVRTTLPEIPALRAGVCQDAHLAIGALRSVGLPGRYVSGYPRPPHPPGKEKLAGSDATPCLGLGPGARRRLGRPRSDQRPPPTPAISSPLGSRLPVHSPSRA